MISNELICCFRYRVPASVAEAKRNLVQIRVCLFIKRWIESNPEDLKYISDKVNEFFDQVMSKDGYAQLVPGIKKYITEMTTTRPPVVPPPVFVVSRILLNVIKIPPTKNYSIIDLDENEVALQLSSYHFKIYQKIKVM